MVLRYRTQTSSYTFILCWFVRTHLLRHLVTFVPLINKYIHTRSAYIAMASFWTRSKNLDTCYKIFFLTWEWKCFKYRGFNFVPKHTCIKRKNLTNSYSIAVCEKHHNFYNGLHWCTHKYLRTGPLLSDFDPRGSWRFFIQKFL